MREEEFGKRINLGRRVKQEVGGLGYCCWE